jgi:hypothetical protein
MERSKCYRNAIAILAAHTGCGVSGGTMFGRTQTRDSDGLPCFDFLVGWLLWGMRNSRRVEAVDAPQPNIVQLAQRD